MSLPLSDMDGLKEKMASFGIDFLDALNDLKIKKDYLTPDQAAFLKDFFRSFKDKESQLKEVYDVKRVILSAKFPIVGLIHDDGITLYHESEALLKLLYYAHQSWQRPRTFTDARMVVWQNFNEVRTQMNNECRAYQLSRQPCVIL